MFTTTIAAAVTNVSFSACSASGSVNSSQNPRKPGSAAWIARANRGKSTITPRYASVTAAQDQARRQ